MIEDLECYLVGGAVRDQLLGRPVVDRDWVVVGSTAEELRARGFTQVGRDFPVFLHPQTREEYALARTERKTGAGHQGFEVFAEPTVTLAQDLARRDLTINALAQDARGEVIDLFNGVEDLHNQVLRHISDAFKEDPLRVFRVARLAAQLPGFEPAPETRRLLKDMCAAGELLALSAERVWRETEKALGAPDPGAYFRVLGDVQGLADWFPELLEHALQFAPGSSFARFVQLRMQLQLTPEQLATLAARLKVPGNYRQIAADCYQYGAQLSTWPELSAEALADLFIALQVQHGDDRLLALVGVCEVPEQARLRQLAEAFRGVKLDSDALSAEEMRGPAYGAALRRARIETLAQAQAQADTARDTGQN